MKNRKKLWPHVGMILIELEHLKHLFVSCCNLPLEEEETPTSVILNIFKNMDQNEKEMLL